MKFAFLIEQKKKKELDALLAADPYAKDSFATIGFVLKESKPIGLKGGFYVVYFKTEDDAIAKVLSSKLTALEGKKLDGEDEKKVFDAIEQEENNATQGFGAIFG